MDFPLFVFFARRNLVGARNGSDKKLKRKKKQWLRRKERARRLREQEDLESFWSITKVQISNKLREPSLEMTHFDRPSFERREQKKGCVPFPYYMKQHRRIH